MKNLERWVSILLMVMFVGLCPSVTTAQTTILTSADAVVRAGQYADQNFGTLSGGDGLRVRAARTIDNKRLSYIKFDLSTYVGVVGSAKLSIWIDRALSTHYDAVNNPNADTANFHKVSDDSWTESGITWNNAPAPGELMFTQAFRHRVTADPDTMYELDVTAYVKSEYAGDKTVTFALVDSDTSHDTDLRIYSRETFGFEPALLISAATAVEQASGQVPDNFSLLQNYPNPFNPKTVVSFLLPVASNVSLVVYDVLGQEMVTLVKGMTNAGSHSVAFDAGNLGSGVYFYTLTAGNFRETKRMVVTK